MVKSHERLDRLAVFFGLAVLLTAGMAFAPGRVAARPYDSGPTLGDPYGMGDPTADDQPSPTPKPTSRLAASIGGGGSVTKGGMLLQRRGSASGLWSWMTILKLSFRLGLR